MITVKTLKKLLESYPEDACVVAYEGEDVGLKVTHGSLWAWITARDTEKEDEQKEKHLLLKEL